MRTQPQPFVYFMQPIGGGPIKIGWTRTPRERLQQMSSWSPVPLQILLMFRGDRFVEGAIHACHSDALMHREWFEPTKRLLALIEFIRIAGHLPQDIENRWLADRQDYEIRHGCYRVTRARRSKGPGIMNDAHRAKLVDAWRRRGVAREAAAAKRQTFHTTKFVAVTMHIDSPPTRKLWGQVP